VPGSIRSRISKWGEEIGLLLACLRAARQPVTAEECAELLALLEAMGLPGTPTQQLDADGT
jgi:hypothetical protein